MREGRHEKEAKEMNQYSDVELAALVAGIVSVVRQIFPQVDGKGKVWVLALGIAVVLCLLIALPDGATWQAVLLSIQRAFVVAAQAVAGASLVGYAGGKIGGGNASGV